MTTPPEENTITPDEISLAFSETFAPTIGRLTFENLRLKKEVQKLLSRIANMDAQNTQLKNDYTNMARTRIDFESQIHNLQKELSARPTAEDVANLEAQIVQLVEARSTVGQTAGRPDH